jgi:hypothetical protein
LAVRKDRNRASAQAGIISQLGRGQHSGLRPFYLSCPDASGPISFVRKSRRSVTAWRIQFPFSGERFRGNSRPRRSRVCEPWRRPTVRDSEQFLLGGIQFVGLGRPLLTRPIFRPASIKVMQRTFNPWNRARYPGGPPFFASWCNSSIPGFDPEGLGANPSEAATFGRANFDRSVVK